MAAASLIFDIGSSSVRATLIDVATRAVISAARHPVSPDAAGRFDADALLAAVTHVAKACQQSAITAQVATTSTSSAPHIHLVDVGFAVFVSNLVGVDASTSRAVTPLYCYANNSPLSPALAEAFTRELAAAQGCTAEAAASAYFDRVGAPVHPSYAPVLVPLARRERSERQQLAGSDKDNEKAVPVVWCSLVTYILSRWLGVPAAKVGMSLSSAAWAGLLQWSSPEPQYDGATLAALQLRVHCETEAPASNCVPPLRANNDGIEASPAVEYLDSFPLLSASARCRWHVEVGDGAAASVGSGCLTRPVVSLTIGTSAAVRVLLPIAVVQRALCCCTAPAPSDATATAKEGGGCSVCGGTHLSSFGLFCYRYSHTHVVVGGAISDAGSVFAWATNTVASAASQTLTAAPVTLSGPSPVLCLPFWSGERATGWQGAAAKGCFVGLNHSPSSTQDMLQATMEGVSYRLAAIFSRLRTILAHAAAPSSDAPTPAPFHIVCSGGAIVSNTLWQQLLATILDVPIFIDDGTATAATMETTTAGAFATLHPPASAGSGSGDPADISAFLAQLKRVEPIAALQSAFALQQKRYNALYDGMKATYAALAAVDAAAT